MAEIPHDDVADEEALLAFGGVSAESVHPLLPKGLPPDEVPGAPLTPEQRLLIEEEDFYRTLFATNRTAPEVDDPHVTLVDVFKERETFAVRAPPPRVLFAHAAAVHPGGYPGGASCLMHR